MPNTNPVLSNAASGAPSTKSGGSRSSARLFPGVPISHNLVARKKCDENSERHVVPPTREIKRQFTAATNERTNEREKRERERERERERDVESSHILPVVVVGGGSMMY